MILLDTDHFSLLLDERLSGHLRLASQLRDLDDTLAIPVIGVEEQLRAWLALIHRSRESHRQVLPYERLIRLTRFLCKWEIEPWTNEAADQFDALRKARIRIGTQDLKIAAIALVKDALLLSSNLRDFEQVPGLNVEDWVHS